MISLANRFLVTVVKKLLHVEFLFLFSLLLPSKTLVEYLTTAILSAESARFFYRQLTFRYLGRLFLYEAAIFFLCTRWLTRFKKYHTFNCKSEIITRSVDVIIFTKWHALLIFDNRSYRTFPWCVITQIKIELLSKQEKKATFHIYNYYYSQKM